MIVRTGQAPEKADFALTIDPGRKKGLLYTLTFVKPNQGHGISILLCWEVTIRSRADIQHPPHKKKVLVTGIDRGQYGLLASGPGALAGLLPTNRVTQPPNFLSKVVFAGGVKGTLYDTSFFIVLYQSRHMVTQFHNLNESSIF